jgi:sulfatase maturation enzyme AslB (radical SAM superfamily)
MKCIDAFKNLNIVNQNNQLSISPCCISPIKEAVNIDFINNKYLNQIRETWLTGEYPTACFACKNAEASGVNSRRLGVNQWYSDNGYDNLDVEMITLDYWTGDTCNLRCVICGPNNSSSWKEELKIPAELRKSSTNYFWKELDLTKLKLVHFNGGEPLLSKEHIVFLRAIPNKKQVQVTYNTNGTILPSDELLNLWQEFKLVYLDFSIDDIGERFEYQRYPAKWDSVTNNLQWFINNSPHNCMFGVNTSIGILNYNNIEALDNWIKANFFVTNFTDPIEHKHQLTTGLFAHKDAILRKDSIVKFLDGCDSRRGTNWKMVFPELDNAFKN